MEAQSLPAALALVAGGGAGLSPERRAALGASLPLVQRDYRFERVWFWGCIQGLRGAYYIAEGLGPDRAAPRSRLYSFNCLDWSLLTPATEEMLALAEQLKGHFQGDPSFEYSLAEINAEAAARLVQSGKEVNPAKRFRTQFATFVPLTLHSLFSEMKTRKALPLKFPYFSLKPVIKEEDRLIATIEQIDRAVGIVPRGAFVKTPLGSVHENRYFEGLSLVEAKKLRSYFHFTEPANLKNKTLLEKADLDPSTDFLDSLEHDIPRGKGSKIKRCNEREGNREV
ncbi:Radial spoke head protein 9 [Lonchura striata]|uniref:Radial spoke head protein 9 homolog n=1 Tax=Lonchura striata TaxID=40157 RepID=A0A218V251_9PASE|nr:Radial spoke head protein 9 [Lonchura striata domestica]